ncbi:MAG TPA: type II secretion system protein GspN [Kofleriaceae bacterium]|nr:type II secretion system protein GspN [Kofleriaceae bacterium]
MALNVKLPFRMPHLGPRTQKILKYVGYVVLAIVTFVFAVQATFPYHRVKAKIEEMASSKYDLTIGDIERGIIPGRFYLKNVTLKTRPTPSELEKANAIADPKERDKALAQLVTTVYVEKLKVDLDILPALRGVASVNFDATFGKGSINGNVAISKSGTEIHIEGEDVPSQQLPMREVLSNLPMSGKVEFEVDLDLPNGKLKSGKVGPDWTKAVASAEFSCPSGCTIGDGKAKLKLKAKNQRSQAFAGEGTDFGTLKIESLLAQLEMKDGKLDLTKFETKSPDIELHVDYTMTVQQELNDSVVLGCLRFKGTEALKKREPKTYDQVLLTGAARAPDGLDNIRLSGTVKDMKKLPQLCGPGAASAGDIDKPGTSSRPNLTVQPDEPVRPGSGSATVNPPPPPMPPAMLDAGAGSAPSDATVVIPGAVAPGSGSAGGSGVPSAGSGPPPGGLDGQPIPPEGSGSSHATTGHPTVESSPR